MSAASSPAGRDLAVTWGILVVALLAFAGRAFFDLQAPPPYEHDGLSHAFLVKTVLESGWFARSDTIGAPFGAILLDYPYADGFHFLLLRVLGLAGLDAIQAYNAFFIAGFFLSAASAWWVLRSLGLASPWAIAGGVLFALLPYHFLRRHHLLLASYFAVPLGVYLACLAARPDLATGRRRPWVCAVLAVVVGSAGIYYALFSAFLIAVGGGLRLLSTRTWSGTRDAFAILLVLAAAVVLNAAPSLVHRAQAGANPEAVARSADEVRLYALRPLEMLLPSREHRLDRARGLAERYTAVPADNESRFATLGLVGALGLVAMLVVALGRTAGASTGPPLAGVLSALGIAALLLAVDGGIGSGLAYLGVTAIRAYNRISIFLGFIALGTLLAWLQAALARRQDAPGRTGAWSVLLACALVLLGAFDQVPRYSTGSTAAMDSDRAFVAALEARLPAGTAVLQLPYQPFPEGTPVHGMGVYEPLRPVLHSHALRWSYGAMRGREGDLWLRLLLGQELTAMLPLAAQSGFGALVVARRGYADGGAAVLAQLAQSLGPPIAQSADGAFAAFALDKRGDAPVPLAALLPREWMLDFARDALPTWVAGLAGFSGREPWGRWTDARAAHVDLAVPLPQRFTLQINVAHAMPPNVDRDIVVEIGGIRRTFRIGPSMTAAVAIAFELPAPARRLTLHVPEAVSPRELGINADTRRLGIGVASIAITPLAEQGVR